MGDAPDVDLLCRDELDVSVGLVNGPPANAIWFQNMAPVWVMLVSVYFLKEKSSRADWWMLGLCTVGVLLILVFELSNSAQQTNVYSAILGLLSGVLYAGVVLSLRWLRDEDSAWLVVLNFTMTAVVMAPLVLVSARLPHGTTWLVLIGFGMFQMGLPYLLFAHGLRRIPGHIASLLTLLEPILLPVWIYVAWGNSPDYEPPRWWTIVGGGLILSGLCVRFLPQAFRAADRQKTG